MDYQPTILQLTVLDGKANTAGTRLLAIFTLSYAGMSINGCVLTENAKGMVRSNGPRGTSPSKAPINTSFSDPELAALITERADAAYRALTGKSAMEA
ncbi:hypothetical protein DL1_11455 [Thioclava dalianensis]|uniref:Uncharacterized protein n=1 Tax=Thioclava dalianensis TaxID=1185766 RepID=A0A074U1J8_9RHOB|nr:hypothetical protein [Thioclava dalianensis]KEP68547.1 hypothetical protein DL1_11455 [Thioclava dalianensis]SFN83743.1 hypothetical protein SAMN05216224_1176 [Thioclava dalianensis]